MACSGRSMQYTQCREFGTLGDSRTASQLIAKRLNQCSGVPKRAWCWPDRAAVLLSLPLGWPRPVTSQQRAACHPASRGIIPAPHMHPSDRGRSCLRCCAWRGGRRAAVSVSWDRNVVACDMGAALHAYACCRKSAVCCCVVWPCWHLAAVPFSAVAVYLLCASMARLALHAAPGDPSLDRLSL